MAVLLRQTDSGRALTWEQKENKVKERLIEPFFYFIRYKIVFTGEMENAEL